MAGSPPLPSFQSHLRPEAQTIVEVYTALAIDDLTRIDHSKRTAEMLRILLAYHHVESQLVPDTPAKV